MPRLALLIVGLWFVALFVFRTALQWWRTGSGGIKGFSGRVGSLEWNAGFLASAGLVAAVVAPIASLRGWPGGDLLVSHPTLHLVGAGVAVVGIAGALVAQISMGDSWRVGVDEAERTQLVTHGVFACVRNPIFSFMMFSLLGLLLLIPSALAFLALSFTVAGIEIQVRAVEEPYLLQTHGLAYKTYATQTGRFLPRVGRLSDTRSGNQLGAARRNPRSRDPES